MQKKYIAIIAAVLLVGLIIFIIFKEKNRTEDTDISTIQKTEINVEDSDELTPEEVLEMYEEPTSISSDLSVEIISPEEDTFVMSQARMWEGKIIGYEEDKALKAVCTWSFYLNEYNEEVLYKTQENWGYISKNDTEICGFTSTFIDRRGELRVVLDVEVQNAYGDVLDTLEVERELEVL